MRTIPTLSVPLPYTYKPFVTIQLSLISVTETAATAARDLIELTITPAF